VGQQRHGHAQRAGGVDVECTQEVGEREVASHLAQALGGTALEPGVVDHEIDRSVVERARERGDRCGVRDVERVDACAGRAQLVCGRGVADPGIDLVAASDQLPCELEPDAAIGSGDDGTHRVTRSS
jgi:hypothetical protein